MIPKRQYIRSPALMAAWRTISCQCCGADDGTVCGAHSNWAEHGKGKAIKADDNRCASLCAKCHAELDQGKEMTKQQRQSIWWSAHILSVFQLLKASRWPTGVPVPEINQMPESW